MGGKIPGLLNVQRAAGPIIRIEAFHIMGRSYQGEAEK